MTSYLALKDTRQPSTSFLLQEHQRLAPSNEIPRQTGYL